MKKTLRILFLALLTALTLCAFAGAAQADCPGHVEVIGKAIAPTCTEDGQTPGSYCGVCGTVLVVQDVIPAYGHSDVLDEGFDPTCTEPGLTQGTHCERCGIVLRIQEVIPANGHVYEDGVCGNCGVVDPDYVSCQHDWADPEEILQATCETEGEMRWTCSVCGETKTEITPAAHKASGVSITKEPTCTEEGEEASLCWWCAIYLDGPRPIPALGHSYVSDSCERCGERITSGQCGDDAAWNYDAATSTLTIFGSGRLWDYYSASETPWYGLRDEISCVQVQQGITSIGWGNFQECGSIKEVALADSITDIGAYAFLGCTALEEISLPSDVTRIYMAAFAFCASLTEISLPVGVKEIDGNAFEGCTGLKSVTIPAGTTRIGPCAFSGCTAMESVIYGGSECSWIGLKKAVAAEASMEGNEILWDTAATFGQESLHNYVDNICTICGTEDPDYIPPCDHNWEMHYSEEAHWSTCTLCGAAEDPQPHAYYDAINMTSPTCTEPGIATWICRCGWTYDEVTEEPFGHDYKEGKCTLCGMADPQYMPPCTHSWDEGTVTTPPTCTGSGVKTYTCTLCGETKTEAVASGNHSIAVLPAVAPTCTTEGKTEGKHCSVCGTVTVAPKPVPTVSHAPVTDPAVKATCTESGKTEGSHCGMCGKVLTAQKETPAAHTYADPFDTVCAVCGAERTILSGQCGDSLSYVFTQESGALELVGTGRMWDWERGSAPWSRYSGSIQTVWIPDGVENIGDHAFVECRALQEITLPDSVISVGASSFKACASLERVCLGDSVVSIGRFAFCACRKLTDLRLPAALASVCDWAFAGCESLENVCYEGSLDQWRQRVCVDNQDTKNDPLVVCGGLHYNCGDCLPGHSEGNGGCIVPDGIVRGKCGEDMVWEVDTAARKLTITGTGIMDTGAKDGHHWVDDIPWADFDHMIWTVSVGEGVTTIGDMAFLDFSNLRKVELPSTLTKIDDEAFDGCSHLAQLRIPNGVTEIGDYAFAECYALENVTFGRSLTYIGRYCLRNCTGLREVNFAPTSLERIEKDAFEGCLYIETVALPNTLSRVGSKAFQDCLALYTVRYTGTEEQWNRIVIESYNDALAEPFVLQLNWVDDTAIACSVSGVVDGGKGAAVSFGAAEVTAQGDGSFVIDAVEQGTYDLTVKKAGCLTYTVKDITVDNEDIDLGEIELLAGDVTGDEKINMQDLRVFLQNFNKTGENIGNDLTDVSGDNKVNMQDLRVFLKNFNKTAAKDCTVSYQ